MKLCERKLVSPDLVCKTEEKVSIVHNHLNLHRIISFEVGNKVFLKVSAWKRIIRFGQKGKLSPRFVGPYEVLERVGLVAYKLALPSELSMIHNVFHVSRSRTYKSNHDHVMQIEELEVEPNLSYLKELVFILAREVKEIRYKKIH
ncbi:DNA/RNA polymerases superfamily protein [Gossypium australe]|uniref:DNA/RNA polymerases superfamily protein n=1 Tax=Gossypium australe TaxID=47621 RepID=A0A5B6X0H3_9ROSI|nr:DNA/RNA polymerases superfamily protein [Gossypium australe]